MSSRLKPVVLWAVVWLLGLFVGGYLLGAAALLLEALAKYRNLEAAFQWWATVAAHPWQVLRLLLTDPGVKRYALMLTVCLGLLWFWWRVEKQNKETRPTLASHYGSHGTGRWAEAAEVIAKFPGTGPGAVLGRLRQKGRWRPVIFPWNSKTRNRFVLIVGPPGSGKTSRYSLPNLLHTAQVDRERSLLITDPKGEIYRNMAGLLRERGFEIRSVNLLHPRSSDRYNPMDYVHSVEEAFRLANTIISNTSGQTVSGDAFWTNAERSLLACLIWYVKTQLAPEYQHLAGVLALGNAFARDKDLMDNVFGEKALNETAKRLYGQVASLSDKTRDGVFIGFAVRLQLWASPEIAGLTAKSDFSLRDLGRKPVALFLIIPDHHSTYQALTSLFFDQAFQELIGEADESGGRLRYEVRFMLEEMANIGRIPDLEKRLATIRSRGILVEMVLQTMGQLKALYGEAWNTIVGCADTIIALAANDQETAEWLSKRLGTSTIRTTSTSSTATERGESSSESYHYTSRALMLPDEIQGQGEQGLHQDELLLIQRGFPPARLQKYPVEEFPGADQRMDVDPRAHPAAPRSARSAPEPDPYTLVRLDQKPSWFAQDAD